MSESELLRDRAAVILAVKTIGKYVEKATPKTDSFQLSEREVKLRQYEEKYEVIQTKLEFLDSDKYADDREVFQTLYFDLVSKIKTILTAQVNQAGIPTKISLPNIQPEPFSGNYQDWYPFRDLFLTIIGENNQITDVQKLVYLKSYLRGDALGLINNLPITHGNYQVAWATLTKRFDNNIFIVNSHLNNIFEAKFAKTNEQLKELILIFKQNLDALKNLKVPTDQWDVILVYLCLTKVDNGTRRAWELNRESDELPTILELFNFIEQRVFAIDIAHQSDPKPVSFQNHNWRQPPHARNNNRIVTHIATKDNQYRQNNQNPRALKQCEMCGRDHYLVFCDKFKQLTVKEKIDFARLKNMCFKCLKSSRHQSIECHHQNCYKCHKPHSVLIHFDTSQKEAQDNMRYSPMQQASRDTTRNQSEYRPPVPTTSATQNQDRRVVGFNNNKNNYVLLSTAKIHIQNSSGQWVCARALLDGGSQTHIITSKFLNKLRLQSVHEVNNMGGINGSKLESNRTVELWCRSLTEKNVNFKIKSAVVDNITFPLPSENLSNVNWNIPTKYEHLLADPNFNISSEIDVLIGADIFYEILKGPKIKLSDLLVMIDTSLGWIIAGQVPNSSVCGYLTVSLNIKNSQPTLNEVVSKFWMVEELAVKRNLTTEENNCEKHFAETTYRDKDSGKFVVSLPYKNGTLELGRSFEQAYKRLLTLEKRLKQNKPLQLAYSQFIYEYVEMNHMEKVIDFNLQNPHPTNNCREYYVPHFGVYNENSCSTPLRVVFDASAKTTNNKSLNDNLLVGPTVQRDLFQILIKFRVHDYVFSCDIKKMFRNILLSDEDQNLMRILWRNSEGLVECFRLKTVTYGTSIAPYHATRCLVELANQNSAKYPQACEILKNDVYVDDILTGSDNLSDLKIKQGQLINILKSAGFELHKFTSNHLELLKNVKTESKQNKNITLESNLSLVKTLGLLWSSSEDVFVYKISLNAKLETTKREVLSCLASIFDPLHLLGPVIICAKLILQKMWLEGRDWDDRLSDELLNEWSNFKKDLTVLESLRVNRNLKSIKDITKLELVTFCDASAKAYGACVYLRCENKRGEVSVSLVAAKSRVAPLKVLSLPRLELMAATIGARLASQVQEVLKIDKAIYVSDSTIVLHWLNSPPTKWNVFVANRVNEIQQITNVANWVHVNSAENAADCLSRGIKPQNLHHLSMWWRGPSWLTKPVEEWNIKSIKEPSDITEIPEAKKISQLCLLNLKDISFMEKFSKFSKLLRVVAWCLRFVGNARLPKSERFFGEIRLQEFNNARTIVIKCVQQCYFQEDISNLRKNHRVSNKSKIKSLVPFLDKGGVLRVTGRLENSELDFSARHQIILPRCNVVKHFIQEEHIRLQHSGCQAMMGILRERYWIVNAKDLIRYCVRTCITCYRHRAKVAEQLMGNLPSVRVNPSVKCFETVGIDYGGPFYLKASRLKRAPIIKTYVALFVCLATRGIHLELVSDMTGEAFMAAFRRFTSRRGLPVQVFSDNGSNFKAVKNELSELYKMLNDEEFTKTLNNTCTNLNIKWSFIPPMSPNFGGIWEAGIKSTKYHLKRVVGETRLTFEEMSTVLTQVEACLNSRPLTPLSSETDDLTVLTPGHFLTGGNLCALPDQNFTSIPDNRLKRWDLLQKMVQSFWKRWQYEYLQTLQVRNKQFSVRQNLSEGIMVLIKEDNLSPTKWQIGRVESVIAGADQLVRVANVRTSTGVYKRCISKLCVLPFDENKGKATTGVSA